MRRLLRFAVFIPLFALFISVVDIHNAYACSGGGTFSVAGLIGNSDYVIKAHAVEIDDRGQNAIVEVEEYLVGGAGAQYIVISQNSPFEYEAIYEGLRGGGDCAGIGVNIPEDHSFYVFARRTYDGSYDISHGLFNNWLYAFPNLDSTVEIYPEGGAVINDNEPNESIAEPDSGVDVTEAEFLNIIAEISREAPIAPLNNMPYPRLAPLQITTTNADYLLPVDNDIPIEITEEIWQMLRWIYPKHDDFPRNENCQWYESCAQLSPNNMFLGMQIDENTIGLSWNDFFEGQALLFSPIDAVAIWNNTQIQIYTLGYPRLGQRRPEIELLNSIELNSPSGDIIGRGAWSPDGRLLTYSDSNGLWLWDVYSLDSEPRLLIPATNEGVSIAHSFSPMGRYLAIETNGLRQNYDIISSEYYPDGLISPDDRILLRFDEDMITFCSITEGDCILPRPLSLGIFNDDGERELLTIVNQVTQIEWISRYEVIISGCVLDTPEYCGTYRIDPYFDGWYSEFINYGRLFDYDSINNVLVSLIDNAIIQIGRNEIDLSGQLDGDIVSIEWMPSLFYYR